MIPPHLALPPAQKEHIDAILDEQTVSTSDGGVQRFLVRWRGRPESDTTWITRAELQRIDPDLLEYYQSHSSGSTSSYPGGVGADTSTGLIILQDHGRRRRTVQPLSLWLD